MNQRNGQRRVQLLIRSIVIRVTRFVSPQLVSRPERSDAVPEAADELLDSPVNHHEVVHHAAKGAGGEGGCGGAVDAALGTYRFSLELLKMSEEMSSQFVVGVSQLNKTHAALNGKGRRR